jgi:hypothetical protein
MVNLEPLVGSTFNSRINSFQMEMLLRNLNAPGVFGEDQDSVLNKFSAYLKTSFKEIISTNAKHETFTQLKVSPNDEFLFLLTNSGKFLVSDFFCSGKNLVSKQVS